MKHGYAKRLNESADWACSDKQKQASVPFASVKFPWYVIKNVCLIVMTVIIVIYPYEMKRNDGTSTKEQTAPREQISPG